MAEHAGEILPVVRWDRKTDVSQAGFYSTLGVYFLRFYENARFRAKSLGPHMGSLKVIASGEKRVRVVSMMISQLKIGLQYSGCKL